MSGFSELSKIPSTIFSGMPTDKLAAIDPSKITDIVKPLNNYKRSLIGGADEILKALPSMKQINDVADKTKKAINDLTDKVQMSNLLDKIPGMTPGIKRDLLSGKTLRNLQNASSPQDYLSIAGDVFEVSDKTRDMAGALNDIYKIASDKTFFSRLTANLQSSLVGVGVDIAGDLGFAPVAELLIDNLGSPTQKRFAWSQTFYSFARSSDLDIMKKAIDRGGLANIFGLTSEPVVHVLDNFRFDLSKSLNVKENTDKLLGILDSVEPEWLKYKSGEQTIYKLDSLTKLSKDAMTAFEGVDEIRALAKAGSVLKQATSRTVMKRAYPILNELMQPLDVNGNPYEELISASERSRREANS